MKLKEETLKGLSKELKEIQIAKDVEFKEMSIQLNEIRERIDAIIKFCDEGIINKPKGIWFLRCPKCKSKLQITLLYANVGTSYRTPVRHKYCVCLNENCEYEYAEAVVRG